MLPIDIRPMDVLPMDARPMDVIPMDVCHILLEKPWQYDRKAIHDGIRNTYTLEKNG